MATLTGQQALEYMQRNPGKYRVLAGQDPFAQEQQGGGGLLGGIVNFGKSLVSPFTDTAKYGTNLLGFLAGGKGAYEQAMQGGYKPVFGTEDEFNQYLQNPLTTGVKDAAVIGSYAVPGAGTFGGGLKGTLAAGGISGGMAGFGTSQQGKEIEGTLMGTGTGLATAGALYGAGRGVKALKEGGARSRLKDKGLLGTVGDADIKGGTTGSKLDFNQAMNRFDDVAPVLSPEEQAQTLMDIKKITPKEYQGAIDMQIQMRSQANAPLGQQVSSLTDKGIGKYTARYDPSNPKPMAEQFDSAVTGKSPAGQNRLQKDAIRGQYKQLGLTTKKGSLNYVKDYDTSINKLEQSREFFGLPRTPEGISQIPEKAGSLRDQVLDNYAGTFDVSANNIASENAVNDIVRNAPKDITRDQARMALTDKLRASVDPADLAGLTPEQQINLSFQAKPGTLQQIKANTADSYVKVIQGKRVNVDDLAAAQIHKWVNKELATVPGYSKLNDTFSTLYKANEGFRRAYDTGLRGSYIASPQDARSRVLNSVFNLGNKGVEKVGDIGARMQNANLPNLGINNMNIPTQQMGQFGVKVAPSIAAQSMNNFGQQPMPRGETGDVMGAYTSFNPSGMGMPQGGMSGMPSYGGGFSAQSGGIGGVDTNTLKERLGMAVLLGQIDPAQANAAAGLLGLDQSAATTKPTEKQMQFSNAAQSAQDALNLLESGQAKTGKIQGVGDAFSSFFGTQSASQTDYKSRLALARGLAMNALAGANISPSEAKRVADSIPGINDEPAIARQKLRSFIDQMSMFGSQPVAEQYPTSYTQSYTQDSQMY